MTQQVDDSGTRTFGYNTYGERESDSLTVDGDTHLITETRDSFGRSTGFVYSMNGAVQHTVTTGYGTDGRISSAGFTHSGEVKQFGYEYLGGTNLLHKLTKPNNMTLTQTYESTRDLLTGMAYHRGSALVAQREYTYDILGRPTARNTARNGQTMNDTFAHNTRSELTAATVNGDDYEYVYDNIGNRQQATEGNDVTVYDANALNQYTSIRENGSAAFVPQFDADGNQTLIQTDTGIWSAVYNAENRPVTFTNSESNTVVECQYDSMGRRAFKKVTINGSVTLHQRYIYRGYLQIACIDLTRSHHPVMWLVTWDPTQPVATRPLAIRINGTWYTYGWDLTKNICEIFGQHGYIRATYSYSPYGVVSHDGDVEQPVRWCSEYTDDETALIYYNYRYYNPRFGMWICRDMLQEYGVENLYKYMNVVKEIDILGLSIPDKLARYLLIRMLLKHSPNPEALSKYISNIKDIRKYFQLHHVCPRAIFRNKNLGNADRLDNLLHLPNEKGISLIDELIENGLLDSTMRNLPMHKGYSRWHRRADNAMLAAIERGMALEEAIKMMKDDLFKGTYKALLGILGFFGAGESFANEASPCCVNKDDLLDALNSYILELEKYENELARYNYELSRHEEVLATMRKYTTDVFKISTYWNNSVTKIFDDWVNPIGIGDFAIELGTFYYAPSIPMAPEIPEVLRCAAFE